jgi:catechol 2,3-dioxygenase-like lactoylglutathione lyase family enzyme
MKLSAVRVFVHNLTAAHDFYTGMLGLRLHAGREGLGYLVYEVGQVQLVVESVAPDASEEDCELVGRFTGISIEVTDLHSKYEELRKRGVHFTRPPERQAWGGLLATFVDAAENQIQPVQMPSVA